MRFAHIVPSGATAPVLAVIDGEDAIAVPALVPGGPGDLQTLIESGEEGLIRVRRAVASLNGQDAQAGETAQAVPRHPLSTVGFASASNRPPLILAIGLNYSAHSSELGLKTDAAPTVFSLWPNSLSGHENTTAWPRSLSEAVDYEAELGVIIGSPARDVSPEDALDHVWGYTVVNDITARDIQFSEAQWSRCKSFDGFTPTGPFVVTADEIPDPQNLHIWAVVDGQTVQDASTNQMVRTVATLISHLSGTTTLLPGTLISTGSPGGAGYSRDPQIFLRDRSTVTVGIDGIGELTTHCRILD